MSGISVIGGQWGDEGKGKITDLLSENADGTARLAGGPNAGHTVVDEEGNKSKFHMLPSSSTMPDVYKIMGSGMVIDPFKLNDGIESLLERGIEPVNFYLDGNAAIIPPWNIDLERGKKQAGEDNIGTTGRGIGPTYEDVANRTSLVEVYDLKNKERLRDSIEDALDEKKLRLEEIGYFEDESLEDAAERFADELYKQGEKIFEYMNVCDVSKKVNEMMDKGEKIIFEGAQGTFLDKVFGSRPWVTSSHPISGAIPSSLGVGSKKVGEYLDKEVLVLKAFLTRVGKGPFLTELGTPEQAEDEIKEKGLTERELRKIDEMIKKGEVETGKNGYLLGKYLRKKGEEYGTTTGRARRCGIHDSVMDNFAVQVNNPTQLAITKLDVMSGLDAVYICTGYESKSDGEIVEELPGDKKEINNYEPVIESMEGFEFDPDEIDKYSELPKPAKKYVEKIADEVDVEPWIISIGPARDEFVTYKDRGLE